MLTNHPIYCKIVIRTLNVKDYTLYHRNMRKAGRGVNMKIAICDDEEVFIENTIDMIKSILADADMCSITACKSGEELLEKHCLEKYDIIFLDIEMGGISGMETAREIRKYDSEVIIVFLTNYSEFALEGYEVDAYRYLVKNQPVYIFEKQFRSVFEKYSQKHKLFEISDRNTTSYVYLKDICFFEILNKRITVHTLTDEYEFCGKMADIEQQFKNDALFIKPHKSFLINLAHIRAICVSDIIMANGKKVPLSRNYKKAIADRYVSYMMER